MNSKGIVGLIVTGIIAVVVLFFCSITVIPTGKIGVKTQFGAVKGQTLEAGLHFKMPFIQSIKKINCQVQKKELEVSAASKVNSNSQLYKQAGNSIVVNVLEEIFTNLFRGE